MVLLTVCLIFDHVFVGNTLNEVILTMLMSFTIQEMKTKPTMTGRDIIKISKNQLVSCLPCEGLFPCALNCSCSGGVDSGRT